MKNPYWKSADRRHTGEKFEKVLEFCVNGKPSLLAAKESNLTRVTTDNIYKSIYFRLLVWNKSRLLKQYDEINQTTSDPTNHHTEDQGRFIGIYYYGWDRRFRTDLNGQEKCGHCQGIFRSEVYQFVEKVYADRRHLERIAVRKTLALAEARRCALTFLSAKKPSKIDIFSPEVTSHVYSKMLEWFEAYPQGSEPSVVPYNFFGGYESLENGERRLNRFIKNKRERDYRVQKVLDDSKYMDESAPDLRDIAQYVSILFHMKGLTQFANPYVLDKMGDALLLQHLISRIIPLLNGIEDTEEAKIIIETRRRLSEELLGDPDYEFEHCSNAVS